MPIGATIPCDLLDEALITVIQKRHRYGNGYPISQIPGYYPTWNAQGNALQAGRKGEIFRRLMHRPKNLIVPSITIYAVSRKIFLEFDRETALSRATHMRLGQVIDLTANIALNASHYAQELKLPMAVAIVYATAQLHNATVWTMDEYFNRLLKKEPKAGSGNRTRLQKGHLWPFCRRPKRRRPRGDACRFGERFVQQIAASAAGLRPGNARLGSISGTC